MKCKLPFSKALLALLVLFSTHTVCVSQTLEEVLIPIPTSNYAEGKKIDNTTAVLTFTNPTTFNSDYARFDGATIGPTYSLSPQTDAFHMNSKDDIDYFNTFANENVLLSYNNTTSVANTITIPNNHTNPQFVNDYSGNNLLYYFAFEPVAAGDRFLYSLDGTSFTNVPAPTDFKVGGFYGEVGGKMLFNFLNPSFTEDFLFSYDGTSFEPILAGANTKFFPIIEDINADSPYLIFQNTATQLFSLYNYDGTDVTEIPSPPSTNLSRVIGRSGNIMFLEYLNTTTNVFELYTYNGSAFTPLQSSVTTDYRVSKKLETFGDYSYISFANLETSDFQLYLYDNTTNTLSLISTNGSGLSFVDQSLGKIGDKLYLNYTNLNPTSFNGEVFETTIGSTLATQLSLNTNGNVIFRQVVEKDNKLYWLFTDPSSFNDTLFVFNGTELIEIPTPTGRFYGEFQFTFDNSSDLFFTYSGQNFDTKLYILTNGQLSVTENTLLPNISIHPNPASDYIQIELNNKAITKVDLKFYSMLGQSIAYEAAFSNVQSKIKINTKTLSSGVYLLQGKTNLGNFQKKIIIE